MPNALSPKLPVSITALALALARIALGVDPAADPKPLDTIIKVAKMQGVSLRDVIDFFEDESGSDIYVDWHALRTLRLTPTTPISLDAEGQSLGTLLKQIFATQAADHDAVAIGVVETCIAVTTPDSLKRLTEAAATHAGNPKIFGKKLTELRFIDVPFVEVVHFLKDVESIDVEYDPEKLRAFGIDRTNPIKLRVRKTSARLGILLIAQELNNEKALIDVQFDGDKAILVATPRRATATTR